MQRQASNALESHIPVVTCPHCAWAMGALSVLDTPVLARAHLHRALQAHLLKAHAIELPAEPRHDEKVEPPSAVPAAALQAG